MLGESSLCGGTIVECLHTYSKDTGEFPWMHQVQGCALLCAPIFGLALSLE